MSKFANPGRCSKNYLIGMFLCMVVFIIVGCATKEDSFEEILFLQDSYSVWEDEKEVLEHHQIFLSHSVWLKHKLSLDSVASLMELKTLLDEKFCRRGLIYIHLPKVSEKTFLRLYPFCDMVVDHNPKTINDIEASYEKEDLKDLYRSTREATNNKPPVFFISLTNLEMPVQELENRLTNLVKAYKGLIIEKSNKPLNELEIEEKELLVDKFPLVILIN